MTIILQHCPNTTRNQSVRSYACDTYFRLFTYNFAVRIVNSHSLTAIQPRHSMAIISNHCNICAMLLQNKNILFDVRMVGKFRGSNFLWFGEFRQLCKLIFLWCTYIYSIHLVIQLKFSNFSWISRVHEIHENFNPTEITNHTVLTPCVIIEASCDQA